MQAKKETKKIWFRNKTYGWGWTPSTWEGWAVLGVFVLAAAGISVIYPPKIAETRELFFSGMLVAVVALLAICYYKGEKPEWRWGGKPLFKKK